MLANLDLWEVGTAVAAVLIVAAVAITAVDMTTTGPEIREGSFVADTGDGLLAVGTQSCSTDSDCEPTTCAGDDYMIDTDGDVACTDHDGDGDTECTGYDDSYSGAEYCGGRYDYNCDSSGCEGYKAACEDDCGANSGCDTYSFCSSDTDDDSTNSGSDTSSCTDQCTSLAKKCSGGNVVQCQDTDSDSCTDGFVKIAQCTNGCENAACLPDETTNETTDQAEDVTDEVKPAPDDTNTSQTLLDRIHEVWQRVVVALFGGL